MPDEARTREELIAELCELRRRVSCGEGTQSREATSSAPLVQKQRQGAHFRAAASAKSGHAIGKPEMVGRFTQSIDLSGLFPEESADSGSFVIGSEIWATTLGKILQALPISAFLVDDSFKISALNSACARITANYANLEGALFADLFSSSKTKERAQSLIQVVFSDRKPRSWEVLCDCLGKQTWGRFSFRPIRIMSRRFLLVIMEDLSQEKAQLQSNTMLQNELEHKVSCRTEQLARANEQLEKTRQQLAQLNRDLELRIQERTAALVAVNEKLAQEIDRREAVQQELEAEKAKLAGILDAMEDGVHMVDQDGTIQFMNRSLLRDLGPIDGRKCYQYFHDRCDPCPECHMGRVQSGKPTRFEWYCAKNGQTYELMDSPVRNADGSTWKLEIFRNITKRKQAEEALNESEKRYRELIENASDVVFETDATGIVTFVNPAGEKVTGLPREEFVGKHYLDFVPQQFKHEVERFYGIQFVKKLPDTDFEYPMIAKDGRELWLGQRVHLVMKDGEVVGFQSICRDTTERRASEAALRESEERYRNLVERANDGIAIVQNAVVKYANPALARMLGYEYLEEQDQPFAKYIHPRFRSKLEQMYLKRIAGEDVPSVYDTVMIGKGGEEVCVEVNAGVIDLSGLPADLIIMRDVNERRKIEKRLEDSERKFRSVVEHAKEGITVIQKGVFTYVNPAAVESLGYTEDEMISRPFMEFIHPEDREAVKDRYERRLAGEEMSDSFFLRTIDRHGQTRWIEADSIKMEWAGADAVLTFWRDVTERKRADEALKQSEARFRALFENMINGVAVYRPTDNARDFVFSDINQAAERMERVEKKDVLGKPVSEVFPGIREFGLLEVFQRVWQTGETEHHPVSRYQDERIAGWRDNVVYRLPTGDIVAVYSDETERKWAEDERKETESRYRAIVDNALDSIFLKDRDLRYSHVNPAMERLFGLPRAALIGKTDQDLFGEEAAVSLAQADQAVLAGHTIHHESTKPVQGVPITFDVLKVPIVDSSGKVVGICGIARDVTEKRRAEERVRRSEEKYKALFDNSRDGIYITSRDGEIEEANPAFRNMFAFGEGELKGASVLDLYERPQDRIRFQREIEARGSLIDFELALRNKDGRRIDCLISSTVRRDRDGNVIGYEGSVRDVTDRKVLEQQLLQAQKMEAIGTLAGGIAHDFNNILYAIIGFTELALDESANSSRLKKYLAQVLKAGERAKYLVNQILTFSRQSEVDKRPVLIDPIVKEVCKFLRASLPATIDIRWKLSDQLSPVLADPNQIHQVLMNLCANAGHAMRGTAGKLNISLEDVELDAASVGAHPDAVPGLYQRISVTDTGHGIDRNVLDRIFDPYFTTKEKGEGTGLGLAVVHGIVKAHRGIITVESRPGEGSAFRVYLPVVHQDIQQTTESSDCLKTGNECILVVDDEEPITGMIGKMLKRLGYTVVTRTSSVEALELFRHSPRKFDLVITDMTMPNMTGKELVQKIREIRGDIPIILCTGFSELMNEHQAKSMGIHAFLMKPVLREEMARTIRRVLEPQDGRSA